MFINLDISKFHGDWMSLRVSTTGFDDYITTIYRLLEVYGYARTTLISKELGIKPATASKVLKYLEGKGLVRRVRYRGVSLTEKGMNVAKPIVRKHRIAEVFLSDFLGFDLYQSHFYAHKFEHLPDEVIERIYIRLGRPELCPHGNSIHLTTSDYASIGSKLTEVGVGVEAEVIRIAGELTEVLKVVNQLNMQIGSKVRVVSQEALHILVEIPDKGVFKIPRNVAEALICKVG